MSAKPNVDSDMSFDNVREVFGMDETTAAEWQEGWAQSQSLYLIEGRAFLNAAFVHETCRRVRMSPDAAEGFREAQSSLEGNDLLKRFAWHCHCRLFHSLADHDPPPRTWPALPETLGSAGCMFYALVFLSGVPRLEECHRALGIDYAITVDTFRDVEIWMRDYYQKHGVWGFTLPEWMINHFQLRLFRLGRLQFEMRTFPFEFYAFRHSNTREVVIFAGDGLRLRGDGQFDGVNGICDEQAWSSVFRAGDSFIEGNPVSQRGGVERRELRLPSNDWRAVLLPGDPCLGVHIAAECPLDHAACVDSYRQALEFFPKYFPSHAFKAFFCDSWLLDRQLADYLPPSSNIVRFLDDWRTIPVPGADDVQTIARVLGHAVSNPFAERGTSSLQKAVLEHMRKGGRWQNAAGIIFPEDLNLEETRVGDEQ